MLASWMTIERPLLPGAMTRSERTTYGGGRRSLTLPETACSTSSCTNDNDWFDTGLNPGNTTTATHNCGFATTCKYRITFVYNVANPIPNEGLESTQSALARLRPLAAEAAYAFLRTGRAQQAALAVEQGRAVLLSRALALDDAAVTRLAAADDALAQRFRAAVQRIAVLSEARSRVARPGLSSVG